jgi:hypothetical protein
MLSLFFNCIFACLKSLSGRAFAELLVVQADRETYCGAEVVLSSSSTTADGNGTSSLVPAAQYATRLAGEAGWFCVDIPLSLWACESGSVGGLSGVDRVDFQNINIRDADICLDNVQLA